MPLNRAQYRDPVIAAIINYLKPKAHPDIRTWYYGDTLLISKSMLPAVSVAIDGMTLETDSTGDDVTKMAITISVITDINANQGRDFDVEAGTTELYEIVSGKDDNFIYTEDSIMRLLRERVQLATATTPDGESVSVMLGIEDQPLSVDFGIGVERRGPGIFSVEAAIHTTAYIYAPQIQAKY